MSKLDRDSAIRAKRRLKKVLASDREHKTDEERVDANRVKHTSKKQYELSNDIFDQSKDKEPERLNRLSNTPEDPL